MAKKLRRLLCWHHYEKVGFKIECDGYERYSLRQYRCSKCGNILWVDARCKNTCQPDKPLIGWFAI